MTRPMRFKMSEKTKEAVSLKWNNAGSLLDDTGDVDLGLGFKDVELYRFAMATHENGDISLADDGREIEFYSVTINLENCPEPCFERDDLDLQAANELVLWLEEYLDTEVQYLP